MVERTRGMKPPIVTPEQIVERAKAREVRNERVEFLSTGCVMLNLALAQKARNGGWGRSRIVNIVGDGATGKTLLALEAGANVFYNREALKSNIFPPIKEVKIVYWNREMVMDFPLEEMYGERFVKAVDWCDRCVTAEQWGRDVFRRLDAHQPGELFIGILDSLDSLGTEAGQERLKKSVKDDKPMDGTYGVGPERAKYFSSDFFNNLCSRMAGKDFTLILISQIRSKLDAHAFGEKYVRAGGKALDFYTHQVVWLAQRKELKNEYEGHEVVYGTTNRVRVKRNKTAPPFRQVDFDVLFNHGLDDIGSMVNFLGIEKIREFWEKHGLKEKGHTTVSRANLIDLADRDRVMYEALVDHVEAYWREIENATAVTRQRRFD